MVGVTFKRLERNDTLSSRVTAELEQLITGGDLPAGSRLPAERELAERFGVSRTVIREAVRGLVACGLLEVRPGSGTVISAPTIEAAVEFIARFFATQLETFEQYHKVAEVRHLLEIEMAGLAAQRRQQSDIEAMEGILERAQAHIYEPDAFVETDLAFHAALARATGNEMFSLLLDSIAEIMANLRRIALRVPGTPARALEYHRDILEKVKEGDPEGAREAMRRHMEEALETQHKAVESMSQPSDPLGTGERDE